MIKRFFTLAVRNLLKQKQIAFISILGLTIALSVVLQIANWVRFELSYDKFHNKADRIYRFTVEENRPEENFYWHFARSRQSWRTKLPEFFPQIESLVELRPMWNTAVKTLEQSLYNNRVYAVDSTIFHVFDFEFIQGNPLTALNSPNTIVISESIAKKLFPNGNAINQQVELYGAGLIGFEKHLITGIFKDWPVNSHFHIDILVHFKNKRADGVDFAYTYFLLKKGISINLLEERNMDFIKTHVPEEDRKGSTIHYTPITDIHLKSHIERELELNGDIKQIKLFIFIGLGVLLIALINFFNLVIASFEKRNKYFSLNIIIGGKPRHNILLAFIESLIIAIVVISLSFAVFKPITFFLSSAILGKTISASFSITLLAVIIVFLGLVVLLGILPLYIVRINSSDFLSKSSSNKLLHNKSWILNNPMMVIQFTVSILVIICGLTLNKQNNFLFSKNLGHGSDSIVMLQRPFWKEEPEVMLFKDELKKLSVIADVSMCMDPPGYLVKDARPIEYADIPSENKKLIITVQPVDGNFFSFFNLPMVAGETKEYTNGQSYEDYVLNEAAIKKLGFRSATEAIGTRFKLQDYGQGIINGGTIIGVVKDFNFTSLYTPIEPTIFFSKPIWQWRYLLKLAPGDKSKYLAQIRQVWDKVFPDYPMDYTFLDDVYNDYYKKDIITNKLVGWFTLICIMLSSIGLWGMSSILIIKKTKDIGIRKVNGGRVVEIMTHLNAGFIKWVLIAYILAVPLSWFIMHKWLENFAYKTEISWWIFIVAGAIAILVATITVSWQSWRAATNNPVEALRYE